MKPTDKIRRQQRIIARGEQSGHDHVLVGDVEILESTPQRLIIQVGEDSHAALKHLIEEPWIEKGEEVWTEEHNDIVIKPGIYTFVRQVEYDGYKNASRWIHD